MKLTNYPISNKNKKLNISSVYDLLENFEQIEVSQIQHLIKVKKDEIGYSFSLKGENIGIINISEDNEITWIDNINAVFKKPVIKGLGYFMIKYTIKDILQYNKINKFYISNILSDVRGFYEKVAKKLKNERIIKYYVFIGEGDYKDLILFL